MFKWVGTSAKWISKAAVNSWTFLDGKKTAIGTACLIVADYIPRDKTAYAILSITGQLLGGSGLLHKVNKADKLPDGMRKSVIYYNQLKSMDDQK